MATSDDPRELELGHTATLPASGDTPAAPPAESERAGADIESARDDLAELPVVDPETYVFGHYFARGGMGRIAAVRDKRLGRVVAIKELIAREPSLVERFKREIHITARLEHPAIVSIHEAGRWPTGEPFFVMKKVAGQSLKDAIAGRTTLVERLGLVASVIAIVDALAYAHQQGIIHRDLKPANVLVGEFGETVVIDWGLAKDLRRDDDDDPIATVATAAGAHVTVAGSLLGTPAYMAPEQARGEPADERSDVYALGAILYTVLAGEPPYDGTTQAEVVSKVLVEQPALIGLRQPGVPDDLQTIVARAMARDPAARYPSARELAADLKRFQTGQLVAAHKYSRGQLVARWVRRHRGAILVALAALAALIVIATVAITRIIRERDRAVAAERDTAARSDALVVAQARSSVETEPLQALRWLAQLQPDSAQWPAARLVAADATARGLPRPIAIAPEHDGETRMSADGRRMVVGSRDHKVRLVDVATGTVRVIGQHGDRIHDVAISPGGTQILSGSADNTVVLWSDTGEKLRTFAGHDGWVIGVGFLPDDKHVLSTGLDRTTRIWPIDGSPPRVIPTRLQGRDVTADGRYLAGFEAETDKATVWDTTTATRTLPLDADRFSLASDGTIAYVANDRTVMLRKVTMGVSRALDDIPEPISDLEFSPNAARLAVATRTGAVYVIDVRTSKRWSYNAGAPIRSLELSHDGAWIAVWSKDGPVHLIEARSREGRILPGSLGPVMFPRDGGRVYTKDSRKRWLEWSTAGGAQVMTADAATRVAAVSPDGKRLVFGGPNQGLRVWTAGTRDTIELVGHTASVIHAVWSPNGALIASLDEDKRVWLWEVKSGRGVVLPGRATVMLAFAPDGARVAAPGDDESVRTWDVATGQTHTFAGHRGWVAWVGFAPDGELASVGSDGSVRTWPAGTTLGSHTGVVRDAAFSPDGAWLATAGHDGTVRLWPRKGGAARTLTGHTGWVVTVAFDPSSRTLASGGIDRAVRVWDVATGESRVLGAHDAAVIDVTYSPAGTALASTSVDGTVRLWNLVATPGIEDTAGVAYRVLRGHGSWVWSASFFPDGRHLATAGHDGSVRIWADDLPTDATALHAWLVAATR